MHLVVCAVVVFCLSACAGIQACIYQAQVLGIRSLVFFRVKDAEEKGSHLPAGSLLVHG